MKKEEVIGKTIITHNHNHQQQRQRQDKTTQLTTYYDPTFSLFK